MKSNKIFHFQIAVKDVQPSEDKKSVIIQGYASTPDIDRYQDIVEPAAFADALTMFMKNPTLLRSHDSDRPAGNVMSAIINEKGLWIQANVTEEETVEDVVANRMRAFSIGYIPLESTLQHEDGSPFNAEQDSVWDSNLIRVIKRLDLVEISIVSTPANGNALFTIAQSVKSFFNQLVTKSMDINKKDIENEENKPAEVKPVEEVKPEEIKPVEVKPEEEKPVEVKPEEIKPEAELSEEEKAKQACPECGAFMKEGTCTKCGFKVEDDKAAEGAKKDAEINGDKPTGDEPEDKTEKAGEKPAAENGEDVKIEEPIAEVKPEEKPEDVKPPVVEAISVDSETVKALPDLAKAGLIKEAKGAEAIVCPKAITNLIAKLADFYVKSAQEVVTLKEKLANVPDQKALKVTGQFHEELSEADRKAAEEAKKANKEASPEFMALFKNAK